MKKVSLLLSIAVLISGCAGMDIAQKPNTLSSSYKQYENIFNSQPASQLVLPFYTKRKQAEWNLDKLTPEEIDELIYTWLSFPQRIFQENSRVEVVSGELGCLLINGTTRDSTRIAITLRFQYEARWLMDDVMVEYLESFNRYLDYPECDMKRLEQIRLKELKSWSDAEGV